MFNLLKLFFDLCLLKAAPQDLPYSRFLMLLSIGCYFLIGLAVSLQDEAFGMAMVSAVVDTGLLVGLAYLGLWMRDFMPRSIQTVTAFAGTGTLFELMGWPLVTYLQHLGQGQGSIFSLLLLVLIVWNIVVIGNILKHALELPMWAGTGVALLYIYTSLRVMTVLYVVGGTS